MFSRSFLVGVFYVEKKEQLRKAVVGAISGAGGPVTFQIPRCPLGGEGEGGQLRSSSLELADGASG